MTASLPFQQDKGIDGSGTFAFIQNHEGIDVFINGNNDLAKCGELLRHRFQRSPDILGFTFVKLQDHKSV
jgi:hypothetical protein